MNMIQFSLALVGILISFMIVTFSGLNIMNQNLNKRIDYSINIFEASIVPIKEDIAIIKNQLSNISNQNKANIIPANCNE